MVYPSTSRQAHRDGSLGHSFARLHQQHTSSLLRVGGKVMVRMHKRETHVGLPPARPWPAGGRAACPVPAPRAWFLWQLVDGLQRLRVCCHMATEGLDVPGCW